jgi:hypothetical protein
LCGPVGALYEHRHQKIASVPKASQPKLSRLKTNHKAPEGDHAKKGGGMSRRLPDMDGPVLFGKVHQDQGMPAHWRIDPAKALFDIRKG